MGNIGTKETRNHSYTRTPNLMHVYTSNGTPTLIFGFFDVVAQMMLVSYGPDSLFKVRILW